MVNKNPYLVVKETHFVFKYNPNYGDDRVCKCGHTYYRHFDSYDDMMDVGCKYCGCYEFVEAEQGDGVLGLQGGE